MRHGKTLMLEEVRLYSAQLVRLLKWSISRTHH